MLFASGRAVSKDSWLATEFMRAQEEGGVERTKVCLVVGCGG
jgi:hypothetical protein